MPDRLTEMHGAEPASEGVEVPPSPTNGLSGTCIRCGETFHGLSLKIRDGDGWRHYVYCPRDHAEFVKWFEEKRRMADAVNHPPHYKRGKIEVIDFIEDQKLGFHLSQVIKYICRAGHKPDEPELQDLMKARWYLDRYIALVGAPPTPKPLAANAPPR